MSEQQKKIQGPNVRKLIVELMAREIVPKGGGLIETCEAMVKPGGINNAAKNATKFAEEAIAEIKAAPDNTFGDDDEVIAGEILRRVYERDPSRCPACGSHRIHTRLSGYKCMRCP